MDSIDDIGETKSPDTMINDESGMGNDSVPDVSKADMDIDLDPTDTQAHMPEEEGDVEAVVAAFAALGGIGETEEALAENASVGAEPMQLPKASESFPFGAKERPVSQKIDLKGWLKSFVTNKAAWTNVGPVLVFALFIYSMIYVVAERPYLMLLNGEPIAFVQHKEDGQRLLAQACLEVSSPYPAESNVRQYAVIDYRLDGVQNKTKPSDEQMILEKLKADITWIVDGWAIKVSNERTVFLATKALAEEVLDNVKKSYLSEDDELSILHTEFVEPVELLNEEIPIAVLGSPEQAYRTLTEGREPLKEYKVQRGDSYWSIAEKNNMSVDELKLINGAVNNNLSVGQILRLNIPKPLLSVRTTVSLVDYEDIPYDTIYQNSSAINAGESNVLTAGAVGVRETAYQIAHINGFAVEKRLLAETVIAEPVDQVIENGTKAIAPPPTFAPSIVASRGDPGDFAGGLLSWPIRSQINSPFGNRSRGFHSGIDLQAKTGDPVYSAGAGTVISASVFAGYGNQVTIDHGEGLSTMYAHLSQINVKVGQIVGLQELVGLAGSTGRTTGPHLHFEVRINGSPVNPVNYLN
ncbi:MAG: M23 family metallopeptidase [Clostridiales bacterium]|nr:M23 family metallopeptidase [Clostridiales bacterium]